VSNFSDRLMLRYLTPANVTALLVPPGDGSRDRVRSLLSQVYEMRVLAVESVDGVTVQRTRFQVPVPQSVEARAVLDKVSPTSEQSHATLTLPSKDAAAWIDMALEVQVAVKVSVKSGVGQAFGSLDASQLTEQEFVNKFQVIDLPALLKAAGVASYAELKGHVPQLYQLQFAQPPAFNPADPGVLRTYPLRVSALFFPTLDLQGALRQIEIARRALDCINIRLEAFEGGDVLSASAWIAVFPTSAVDPKGPTQTDVASILGACGFVAAFESV
jgi:hypothetical protein